MRVRLHEIGESFAPSPAPFIPLSPSGGEEWGEGAGAAASSEAAPRTLPSSPGRGKRGFLGYR